MPWIPRGLRDGIVTSRYPRRPDGYGDGFSGTLVVRSAAARADNLDTAIDGCPTGAITREDGTAPTRPGSLHPLWALHGCLPRGVPLRPERRGVGHQPADPPRA